MSNRVKSSGPAGAHDPDATLDAMIEKIGHVGRWRLSADDGRIHFSPGCTKILGRVPPKAGLTAAGFTACFSEPDRAAILDALKALGEGRDLDLHSTLDQPGGAPRFVRLKAFRARRSKDQPADCFGLVHDLSEVQNAMMALSSAHERHQDFANLVGEWMWETDDELRYTSVPREMELAQNIDLHHELGRSRRRHLRSMDPSLEMEMHLDWLDRHEPYKGFLYTMTTANGDVRHFSSTAKPIHDQRDKFIGYRGVERDLSEAQQAREALKSANRRLAAANKEKSDAIASLNRALADLETQNERLREIQEEVRQTESRDPLTGIGNRSFLENVLDATAAGAHPDECPLGVLHIGLDRFKAINDAHGHRAGDAVLGHVARLLAEHTEQDDFVARVGGDEFVVVHNGEGGVEALSDLAQRLIEALSAPIDINGCQCMISASIGIATMKGNEITSAELLVNAGMALDRAKSGGRKCYAIFSDEVREQRHRRNAVADGIRAGLAEGAFVPHYQPQICARTGRIAGCEALARWEHPEDGTLTPFHFLDIAEEIGLTPEIDRAIMDTAVADLRHWEEAGLDVPQVSVNLSARRLAGRDLIDHLRRIEMPRGRLAFELLESVFLDDVQADIAWNIDTLKAMGFRIELDDFGSGHSSLVSLVKLGPEAIKIDRQLVATVECDPARRGLVGSIVGIGRTLGVDVTAEGVETEEQAAILAELGCDVLQGYLFARPMPAADLVTFVRGWTGNLPGSSQVQTG